MPHTAMHVMKWEKAANNPGRVEYQSRWGEWFFSSVIGKCRGIEFMHTAFCSECHLGKKNISDRWASDYPQRLKTAF